MPGTGQEVFVKNESRGTFECKLFGRTIRIKGGATHQCLTDKERRGVIANASAKGFKIVPLRPEPDIDAADLMEAGKQAGRAEAASRIAELERRAAELEESLRSSMAERATMAIPTTATAAEPASLEDTAPPATRKGKKGKAAPAPDEAPTPDEE